MLTSFNNTMFASRLQNSFLPIITKHNKLLSSKVSSNDDIEPVFTNRNPRNLERLRIAYKPDGYYVDKPGRSFWHK